VPAPVFIPQEYVVFKDLIEKYKANPAGRSMLKSRHPDINWVGITSTFQTNMRNALASWQVLDAAHLMDAWTDLARELVHISQQAQLSVKETVKATSDTSTARLGFAARATWLILTTAVPPPFGAIVGAVVRGVCGEESWAKVIDRTYEWVMQAPFPHASNESSGRVTLSHVITSGEMTRSARIQYIGGHPVLRELKDFNQVLQNLGKVPNPGVASTIDKWEKRFLPVNLLKLKAPNKSNGDHVANQVHLECRDKAKALVSAVQDALAEWSDDRDNAESVVCAAHFWIFKYNRAEPNVVFMQRMFDPSYVEPTLPTTKRDKKNEIVLVLDTFRNTVAEDLVQELRKNLRAQPVGILVNRDDAQKEFELLLIAHYLRQVTEPPRPGAVDASTPANPEHYANVVGTVPSKVVSSHLEARMLALGIIKKVPLISNSRVPISEIYAMEIRIWSPPRDREFLPVPFKTGELSSRGARGRLAAWAADYIDRVPIEQVFKTVYTALRGATGRERRTG